MKKDQIKIGNVYAAKVTDKVVPVRIDKENTSGGGGWDATNLHTNRQVRIKSAQRLRNRIPAPGSPAGSQVTAPTKMTKAPVKKKLTAKERAASASVMAKTDEGPSKAPAPNTGEPGATGGKPDVKDGKRLSGLDAAAKILAETGKPMNCKDLIERMLAAGLWQTAGRTPSATIYAALIRHIADKGDAARFIKAERGKFAFRGLAKGA